MTDPLPGPAVDSPWAAYGPILTGQIRAVLVVLGTFNITWAQSVTASQIQQVVGAILVIGPMVWSAYQNWSARRNAKEAAIASAEASSRQTQIQGQPVAVVVQPKTSA